ncbi:MAG: hypothetical protein V3R66_05715 [Rhodospirillales bacterium]
MTDRETTTITALEVVGLFADRESFETAVEALISAGFERSDLSVLSSHESIDAAGKPGKPWKDVLTALVGEIKYEGPLVGSVAIYLAGGAVAATVAGIIAAAVGGVAVKEILDEVTSAPNTEDFARSIEAGSVILWVRAVGEDRESAAARILKDNGGANVHIHRSAAATP